MIPEHGGVDNSFRHVQPEAGRNVRHAYDAFAVFFKNLLNMPAADHEKKLVAVRQAIQGLPATMPNYLVSQLQASVTAQDHRIKALLEERARMVGGISLKIGRRLTAPVRWIMGKP